MATMRTMSAMMVVLALSGGLALSANAQQSNTPSYEEPPLASPPSLSQEPSPESAAQTYSQPSESAQPSAATTEQSEYTSPEGADTGPKLQVQDERGIRYVSGGVGEGERAELNALSDQFNLRLLFAIQNGGDYLADIQVSIVNQGGETVLNATSNGPWFYAKLPLGTYTVKASTSEQSQQQKVTINARQSHLNFYWR